MRKKLFQYQTNWNTWQTYSNGDSQAGGRHGNEQKNPDFYTVPVLIP